ncbi:DUF1347 family protein [Chlamydia caviae]|uniref:Uncharacterized protein n=1 Tax=Chlamydia caviae (strain ATCC VR-813 / DSM 19441 / 03DC25 / GPIC) TaxID=227941 RepID=Q821D6_CHLCV|nr:DUF1347 family protein [Chlamydia caviae]AAP05745.1 conserved hypothetical protein [Chlamydia caviae GPIC]
MVRYIVFCLFFLSCFAMGGGLYFICSSHNPSVASSESTKAVALWDEGQKEQMKSFFHHLLPSQQRQCLLCFQGFVLQKQKNMIQSEKIFSKVYDEVESTQFLFKEEVLGGRILNAFFLEDIEKMEILTVALREQFAKSPYLSLFECLLHYKQKSFTKALQALSVWKNQLRDSESSLLELNIQLLISDFFLENIEAHCLIELGEFSEGRAILNRIIEKMLKKECDWDSETYDYAVLMLSRSYFLELKQSHSFKIYPDYYEMILFYKKKVHAIDQRAYEKFIPQEELFSMLMDHLFVVPKERLAPLMQIIKNWERFYFNPNYNLVIQPLIDRFVSSPEQVAHFCNSITFFEIEPLKKKLIDAFGVILSKKVKEVETTKAQQTLSILKSLDSNLWVSEKLIISPEALQDIISQDDADYTNLRKYLNLWETIQSYDIDKQQLVHYLMKGAKQLWNQGSCDDKALNLLRLILQFTNHDIESENIVFLFVKQVYRQMLTRHSITRLLKLEDFITEEGLTPITIREEEIANFLADAEFLYSQGEYHKCYLYSLWLTKIAPSPLAYRLLGLCLLENKCYLEAWGYLHSLPHNQRMHDSKVQKALIICQKHLPKDLGASYKRG